MSTFALTIVLAAAVLHASWNAMVKGAGERSLVMAMVALAHVLCGAAALPFVETPVWEAWPYIIASGIIHWAYFAFLFQSYRFGDLSQVYPIARGMAPMLVAVGALVVIGEDPGLAGWAGIVVISLGIGTLSLGNGGIRSASRPAVLAALATGSMIALYSVVDGIGIRLSQATFGYMAWIFFLEFPIVVAILWHRRQALHTLPGRSVMVGMAGGVVSTAAYCLALYAKTIAPLGAVSAVRESSVIVAALIGVLLFGERPWRPRIAAAVTVAAGVVLLASTG